MRQAYKNIHAASKLGVVALVALLSLVVFFILSAVLAIPIFGNEAFMSLLSSNIEFTKENLGLLKYFQIAQSVGLFIVPSFILAYLFSANTFKYLKVNKNPLLISCIVSVVIVLSASPLINMVGIRNLEMKLPEWLSGIEMWMRQSEESAKQITELFVKVDSIQGLWFNIFMIGFIPAIGEELLFRGVIQRIFHEWTKNKHFAVWISAILFSALHLQFFGFIPRAILGAMFGYLLVYSNNLWLPINAHFAYNTTEVIAYYVYNKGKTNIDPDAIGTNSMYGVAAIISLVVVILLFWYLYNKEKTNYSKSI